MKNENAISRETSHFFSFFYNLSGKDYTEALFLTAEPLLKVDMIKTILIFPLSGKRKRGRDSFKLQKMVQSLLFGMGMYYFSLILQLRFILGYEISGP